MAVSRLLSTLLALAACSGATRAPMERDEDAGGVVAPVHRLESAIVIAANQGGTLELDDGSSLRIPPGALADDSEVVFSREECAGAFAHESFDSCVFQVSATDAEFVGRYEVAIARRDREDQVEGYAVEATPDGWRHLIDSQANARSHQATASGPGRFTSRVADAIPEDDRCIDVPFTACGGALEGAWKLKRACGTLEQVVGISWSGANPYAACKPNHTVVDYPFSATGGLQFDADGTWTARSSFNIRKHSLITTECLQGIGETCHPDCVLEADICNCNFLESEGTGMSGGYWSAGDSGTVLLDAAPARYCVDGDELYFEHTSSGEPHVMIYERE